MPCTGASQEFDVFEVNQSEAYELTGALVGGNYTFSMCNGPGAGSWIPDFTIIAPSGSVEAFGAGDGDGCSITWTASEEGTYLVVISEAGNCGIAGSDENGFPKITTNSGGGLGCLEPLLLIEGAESFEADTILPPCWQAVDADGDGYNWVVGTAPGAGFDGNRLVLSQSWAGTPLTPDNYLITPQLELGDNDSLYYVVQASSPAYPAEKYSVLLSTTGTNVEDFTDVLFTEVLGSAEWRGRSIKLSAYAGQTIYIAFRHFGVTDKERIHMDAIALPGTVICNPTAVAEVEKVESSVFPNPASDNISISSSLLGAATITIFDTVGRVISQKNTNLSGTTYTQNIASLADGIYVIQIQAAAKMTTQRFVKQ